MSRLQRLRVPSVFFVRVKVPDNSFGFAFLENVSLFEFWLSSLYGSKVFVFYYIELFDDKSVRVVIRTHGVNQPAGGNKTPFGDVAGAGDELLGKGFHLIRIAIKVTAHAIDDYPLEDIARDDAVVIAFFSQIFIVVKGRFISHKEGTFGIVFNCFFIGR